MRKVLLLFVSLLFIAGMLAGCSSNDESDTNETASSQTEETNTNDQQAEDKQETVTITISKDHESEYINEKEIPIKDGAILMDVMQKNFEIETDFNGSFITSIDGVAPKEGEQKSWMFFVNGEMPTVGAKEYELSPGDKVLFDLQAWE